MSQNVLDSCQQCGGTWWEVERLYHFGIHHADDHLRYTVRLTSFLALWKPHCKFVWTLNQQLWCAANCVKLTTISPSDTFSWAMRRKVFLFTLGLLGAFQSCWLPNSRTQSRIQRRATLAEMSLPELRWSLLRMAAALDRGQAYNPTSGEYYAERMAVAREFLDELMQRTSSPNITLKDLDGEWELVFSTVKHGIFRSSPFFLAVQEAFGDPNKSELFFKLHELQVMSWGASKVGRVAQYINSTEGLLYSEFDTSLLSMTVIPILGWWKLLPTFGGCVVTVSNVTLESNQLDMEVQYTKAKEVPGLAPLSDWVMDKEVPVNSVWKMLPWNGGRAPTCSVELKYLDDEMRIVADRDGELFVYMRPVDPRGLWETDQACQKCSSVQMRSWGILQSTSINWTNDW